MGEGQEQVSAEAIWSPAKLRKKLEVLAAEGSMQQTISALCGVPGDRISLWKHGWKTPRKEEALEVQKTIEGIFLVLEIDGRKNLSNVKVLRRRLREMGKGRKPALIPQEHGSDYIKEFSGQMHITPEEAVTRMQLASRVVNAAMISAPCQRWIKSWSVAMAQELDGVLFDTYAARFPSRQAALEAFARGAFARLVADAGPAKIKSYMAALLTTGELQKAPVDNEVN
jgi:hypothetical protein